MNSWDCFDTLIARRFVHPHSIFDEVSKRINMPDFKQKRIQAEKISGSTYERIYNNLPGIDPQIEIDVEYEHSFPIIENLEKVEDGDLILSDMYLPKEVILSMLRKCGLDRDVHLEVSSSGKSSGKIWEKFKKENINIKEHCGDNMKSDVIQANSYGFKARHCTKHTLLDFEKLISKENFGLACFIRYLRLQYSPKKFQEIDQEYAQNFWYTQCHWNIPVLALYAKYLEDKGDLAFIYRDCHILHPLYENITNKKGVKFNSSRLSFNKGSDFFKNYAKNITANKTLVDTHASGETAKKILPNNKIITLTRKSDNNQNTDTYFSVLASTKDIIEKANPYKYGTLQDITEQGKFIRHLCEHTDRDIKLIEEIKKLAIANCSLFNILRNDHLLEKIHDRKIASPKKIQFAETHKGGHQKEINLIITDD